MEGWGKGAINNKIGFGQGAAENSFGWGSIHRKSLSKKTSLGGEAGLDLANDFELRAGIFESKVCLVKTLIKIRAYPYTPQFLTLRFEQRSVTDGGTFEAKQCLEDSLTEISNL